VVDLGRRAVEFDDQQRLDIERIAGMDEGLGRVDRGRSIISMPPGMMPAAMMSATHCAAASLVGKADQQRRAPSPASQDAHGDLGDDAEQAFRAGHHAQQVVALAVEMLAAEAHDLAVISTISMPSTLLVVRPYFRQCTPPEFSATLPPMVQAICEGIGRVVEAPRARPPW
jgi:hypothetical protein